MKHANLHIAACAIAVLSLLAATPAAGAAVTAEQARAAAAAWASQNASFGATGSAVSVTPEYDSDGALLWWQVETSSGSSIFTAPDDEMEPVIAAVPNFTGALPANHPLRAMLTTDVRIRARRLATAAANAPRVRSAASASGSTASESPLKAKWGRLVAAGEALASSGTGPRIRSGKIAEEDLDSDTKVILPGFEKGGALTHWDQFGAYQYYTYYEDPDSGEITKFPCGCVATAAATILSYFRAPGPVAPITRNVSMLPPGRSFALTTIGQTNNYDWAALPKKYGGDDATKFSLTEEDKQTLGRATYDAGVCLKMAYTEKESGAATRDIASVLTADFGFASAEWRTFSPNTGDPPGYTNFVYSEILKGYPVAMSINQQGADSGHAVVAVGYGEDAEATPYTRIFMGWGGSYDGWYALPLIDAGVGPAGEEDDAPFNLVNGVVTHIRYSGYGYQDTYAFAGHGYAYSPMAAQRDALERGVPMLLIGGDETKASTAKLLEYVDSNNLTNQFAVYFCSTYNDPFTCADTELSLGVFNPYTYQPSERWSANGNAALQYLDMSCLNYTTNDLYDSNPATSNMIVDAVNELRATLGGADDWSVADVLSDATIFGNVLSNGLETTCATGLAVYAVAMQGVGYVSMTAGNFETNVEYVTEEGLFGPYSYWLTNQVWRTKEMSSPEAYQVAGGITNLLPGVGYGASEYVAGGTYLFHMPIVFTNAQEGVVWQCVGWSATNETTGIWSHGKQNWVEITVEPDDAWTLEWKWEAQAFLVAVKTSGDPGATVFPAEATNVWVRPFTELSVLATSSRTGANKYKFDYWRMSDDGQFYNSYVKDPATNRLLHMCVTRPANDITAVFREKADVRDPDLLAADPDLGAALTNALETAMATDPVDPDPAAVTEEIRPYGAVSVAVQYFMGELNVEMVDEEAVVTTNFVPVRLRYDTAGPEPRYGKWDYKTGDEPLFHMPMVHTNDYVGVIWQCIGWSATNATTGASVSGTQNWVKVSVVTNDAWTLTWLMEPLAYNVSIWTSGDEGATISPAAATNMWVKPFTELTVLATSSQDGEPPHKFVEWGFDEDIAEKNLYSDPTNRTLSMMVAYPVRDVAAEFVEADVCDEVLSDPMTAEEVAAATAIAEPEDQGSGAPDEIKPSPAEPEMVQPGPIAFSAIEYYTDDGVYLLTVTGGVKFCKYTLYESDVPTATFTTKVTTLEPPYNENPYTAVSNGPVLFTVPKSGAAKFWSVKAEEGTVTE